MKLGSAHVFYRQNEQMVVDARCMALDITTSQTITED